MLKALALKELRELAPIAGLALCVYALIVARATGVELFFFQWWPRAYNEVPFVTDSFADMIVLVSACLAVALAVRQTIGESRRSTWHWLLHGPLTRKQIIFVKLAAGVAVYLVCGALPILWYAGWAASPRTHPSPFYWSMTAETCEAWALSLSLYFAAFLCGLWPAHTVGPRWAPVVGMGAAIMFGYMTLSPISTAAIWVLPLVLIGLTVSSIFYISRIRDFS